MHKPPQLRRKPNMMTDQDFSVGDRIQLHPATDAWMRGDRFGQIRKVGRKFYHVAMDVSGRVLRVPPCNILGH
jgi:hypothetical protein